MNRGISIASLLETIAAELTALFHASGAAVALYDDSGRFLLARRGVGSRLPLSQLQSQSEFARTLMRTRSPMRVDDAKEAQSLLAATDDDARSLLAVPVESAGRVSGIFAISHHEAGHFTGEHEAQLRYLADTLADDVEEARRYRLATTDPVTGLYNRQHLAERLTEEIDRAGRYGQALAVLLIDVDQLEAIEDAYGRESSLELLQTIAKRLHQALREPDLMARSRRGGFIAVLPSTDRIGAQKAAARMLGSLRDASFSVRSKAPLLLTGSIGGALLAAHEEARDLMARAEAALFQAKSQGRDRYVFNWLSFAGMS